MRKIISFAVAAAVMCSAAAMPASAMEAATYEEYHEQRAQVEVFPDPDAIAINYIEDSFTFHVYKDYAVLAEYMDKNAVEVTIPAEVVNSDTKEKVPVVGIVDTPFGFCRDLEKITIPDSFVHFDWYSLTCTTLVKFGSTEEPVPKVKEVAVSETNPNYTVRDGLLYSKDMKTLIGCPPALEMKELALPEQTETIGDCAFYAHTSLEKAVVPSTVKHINNSAFTACMSLGAVELPESITSVSGDMFYYCTALTDVRFNGKIEKIGYGAFNHCDSLTEFAMPETVTAVGSAAFEDSPCIENVNGVHYVGNWAVGSDDDIAEAVLREGTVGIADMAFVSRQECTLFDVPASVKYLGYVAYTGLSMGSAAVVKYRAAKLPETALAAAKNATDFYIYDPECDIFDSEKTIPAEYKYSTKTKSDNTWDGMPITVTASDVPPLLTDEKVTGEVVIHGYEGSTAQKYAEKYGRKFELITDTPSFRAGDVNNDGEVGIADAVSLQKWLLGEGGSMQADWHAADLCKDNVIDSYDLIMMRKMLTK